VGSTFSEHQQAPGIFRQYGPVTKAAPEFFADFVARAAVIDVRLPQTAAQAMGLPIKPLNLGAYAHQRATRNAPQPFATAMKTLDLRVVMRNAGPVQPS